jgi:hypothetical protein
MPMKRGALLGQVSGAMRRQWTPSPWTAESEEKLSPAITSLEPEIP